FLYFVRNTIFFFVCVIIDSCLCFFFFFTDTSTTEIYTLSYTTLFRSLEPATYALTHPRSSALSGKIIKTLFFTSNTSCDSEPQRSEEHTSELQSRFDLVCRLLLEKKKRQN